MSHSLLCNFKAVAMRRVESLVSHLSHVRVQTFDVVESRVRKRPLNWVRLSGISHTLAS